jgi:phosphate transport system substrate-binding protein
VTSFVTRNARFHSLFVLSLAVVVLVGSSTGCSRDDGSKEGGRRAVIQNKGSDTLVNVAQAWAENYKEINPSVAIAVSGGGSGTGISSLINGTVDIANSSRKIKDKEITAAAGNGVEPVELIVGYDALAVFIHPNNPIDSISLATLADIYGEGGGTKEWSQLGIEVPGCPSNEIVRVSRQNNSGTYVYFKNAILGNKRDYELGSRDMHGSKDVVDLVENTPCAIGYSGLAYKTDHVKVPCVLKEEGGACVAPSVQTAVDQSYPIARPLFMYTAGAPQGATKEYIDWLMSNEGQCIIEKKGYAPAITTKCE